MCDTYIGLDCHVSTDSFRAVVSGYRVGQHSITRGTSLGHYVDRSRTLINKDNVERVFFGFVLSGRAAMIQAGREAILEPGTIAFNDSTRPFRTCVGESSDAIWLGVPRISIADRLRGFEDMTAVAYRPSRPIQQIAFDLLAGLDEAMAQDLPPQDTDALVVQVLDLLALTAVSGLMAPDRAAEETSPSLH